MHTLALPVAAPSFLQHPLPRRFLSFAICLDSASRRLFLQKWRQRMVEASLSNPRRSIRCSQVFRDLVKAPDKKMRKKINMKNNRFSRSVSKKRYANISSRPLTSRYVDQPDRKFVLFSYRYYRFFATACLKTPFAPFSPTLTSRKLVAMETVAYTLPASAAR